MKHLLLSVAILATTLLTANAATQRTTALDLTAASITYAGGATTGNPTTSDITDSSEGWAWYINGYTPVGGTEITGKVLVLNGIDLVTSGLRYTLTLPANTTIVQTGTNIIVCNMADNPCFAILASSTLTIRGNGALSITATNTSAKTCAMSGASMIVEEGTLNFSATAGQGQAYGISLSGGLTINGGTVNATASNANQYVESIGVNITGNTLAMTGGTLTAQGGMKALSVKTAPTSIAVTGGDTSGANAELYWKNNGYTKTSGGTDYAKYAKVVGKVSIMDRASIAAGNGQVTVTMNTPQDGRNYGYTIVPANQVESLLSIYTNMNVGESHIPSGNVGEGKSVELITDPANIPATNGEEIHIFVIEFIYGEVYSDGQPNGSYGYFIHNLQHLSVTPTAGTGTHDTNVDSPIINTQFYDINGKKLNSKPAKGFYIENNTHENGARTSRTMGAF